MLMAVKNQIKVIFLSIKYNIMRQMVNKVTFTTNILFMILNNASFIIQWVILFSLKDEIGGYSIKDVILLWGIASSTYGISAIVFQNCYSIHNLIINGKLDSFLVQPKCILLSVATADTKISGIGDFIYGYICLAIYGITFKNFILFTFFVVTGAIIMSAFVTILGSICFWIVKGDMISSILSSALINLSTYPGTIFKGAVKIIMYTIIPVGFVNYIPVNTIINFNITNLLIVLGFTVLIVILAFFIFYKGLKRYSSSNLMSSRV